MAKFEIGDSVHLANEPESGGMVTDVEETILQGKVYRDYEVAWDNGDEPSFHAPHELTKI